VPLLVAATLALPVGVAVLLALDVVTMRWLVASLVLAAAILLASGWRYAGRAGVPLSLAVGGVSGLFNGLASLGGMPLAVFWLGAQRNSAWQTRANLQSFFAVSTVVSGLYLWTKGIITFDTLWQALPLIVPYGLALLIGSHGFRLASESTFRRIAYAVIIISAIVSFPVWDQVLAR
jgi:uncharacterized protein